MADYLMYDIKRKVVFNDKRCKIAFLTSNRQYGEENKPKYKRKRLDGDPQRK